MSRLGASPNGTYFRHRRCLNGNPTRQRGITGSGEILAYASGYQPLASLRR